MNPTARTPARLGPEERRRQLIGIGLSLLAVKPIQQLTVEEVARSAGISRNLLFHYFASKREFYAAVVRAACRRLLRATRPPDEGSPERRLAAFVDGYLAFVQRHPESYASVLRGTGGDDWVRDIWEDTQAELAAAVLDILAAGGRPAPDLVRQAVRGWLCLLEEMSLAYTARSTVPRPDFVLLLTRTCRSIVDLAAATVDADRLQR